MKHCHYILPGSARGMLYLSDPVLDLRVPGLDSLAPSYVMVLSHIQELTTGSRVRLKMSLCMGKPRFDSYCKADLRLCFCPCRLLVFPCGSSNVLYGMLNHIQTNPFTL